MKKIIVSLLAALGALGVAHAQDFKFEGSGNPASEVRRVGEKFTSVHVSGPIRVVVSDSLRGDRVQVTADDNALQYVVAEVKEGVLRVRIEAPGFKRGKDGSVRYRGNYSFRTRVPIRVVVPWSQTLGSLSATSGSRIEVLTPLTAHESSIRASGSARIEAQVRSVQCTLAVTSGSTGRLSGQAERLEASVSGSSRATLPIAARQAKITCTSGSSCIVENDLPGGLQATVSGSSRLTVERTFQAGQAEIVCTSGSSFRFGKAIVGELTARISGSSRIEGAIEATDARIECTSGSRCTLTGSAGDCTVNVTGSSTFQGFELTAARFDGTASSGSTVRVTCTERLSAKVATSASLLYKGDPKMGRIDTSNGTIRRVED